MAETPDEVAMQVTTRDLPPVHQGQFYYAWLLDPATQKMLPLGVVGPSGTASFTLPASLLGRYGTVDVSLEKDDGDPGHSVRLGAPGQLRLTQASGERRARSWC